MAIVTDNAAVSRYEMEAEGDTAFVLYRRLPGVRVLTHAEVPQHLSGRGLGSRLVQATLEAVRASGEKVVPRCSFVRAYMARHPEYDDLRAE